VEAQLASKKTSDKYPLHSFQFFIMVFPFYFNSMLLTLIINGKNYAACTNKM